MKHAAPSSQERTHKKTTNMDYQLCVLFLPAVAGNLGIYAVALYLSGMLG